MGNLFLNLPVPAGDGVGAPVDVSSLGRVKTFTVQGDLVGTISIEFSEDGAAYFPLKSFTQGGDYSKAFAAQFLRVRVSGYQSGTGNVDVGSDDIGQAFFTLPAPAGDGVGAGVDVSAAGTLNTITITGDFSGTVTLEFSEDNIDWAQLFSTVTPDERTVEVVAQYMRVRRSGVGTTPGTATVAVGAVNDPQTGAVPSPPTGPASGDLSGTYPGPTIGRPRKTFVYRPGGVAAANVYIDWATMMTAVGLTDGLREIVFDDRFGAINIPVGVWAMDGVTWRAWPEWAALFGYVFINVPEGAVFTGLRDFEGTMAILNAAVATPPVSDLGNDDIVTMQGGVDISSLGAVPFFDTPAVTTGMSFFMNNTASFGFFGPAAPVLNIAPGPGLLVVVTGGTNAVITPATITGVAANTFRFNLLSDSARFAPQAGFLGTIQYQIAAEDHLELFPVPPLPPVSGPSNSAYNQVIRANVSGGPFAVTLAAANGAGNVERRGQRILVKETSGTAGLTVAPNGADTIDGVAAPVAVPAGGAKWFVSDGISNWAIVAEFAPTATATDRYSPPEKWTQANVPASQSNVDLNALVSTSFDTIKAIRAGSIVGLSTRFTGAITDATAGSAIVTVTVNGAAGTLNVSHSSGSNPSGGEAVQAAGVDTFNAGDLLGIEITTLGSFTPAGSLDLEAWMDLEL